jgi:Ca2+:H+ antiporter
MTSAGLEGAAGKEPNSEETVVVRRLETPEQKARYRFINKFFKKNRNEQQLNDELGNTRNRHPWYKGKLLKHQPFTFRNQLEATLGASWVNLLLVVAVPVGFALNYAHANPVAVFFVNFAAVLPMAGLLGYAMDELRLRTGDLLGALIYMSFGYDP